MKFVCYVLLSFFLLNVNQLNACAKSCPKFTPSAGEKIDLVEPELGVFEYVLPIEVAKSKLDLVGMWLISGSGQDRRELIAHLSYDITGSTARGKFVFERIPGTDVQVFAKYGNEECSPVLSVHVVDNV